jgi:adenine-specific DNA methylase
MQLPLILLDSVNQMREPSPRKELGAYYTDSQIAEFLTWWAIRHRDDKVLDPSFGGGVFLRSAAKRIGRLNGSPDRQVYGVEIDTEVHLGISQLLEDEFRIRQSSLLRSDFFSIEPHDLSKVNVVVGNPPFIRYQRFNGDVRKRALIRTRQQGVIISELSSSWLPFIVHSVSFLAPDGRLAMVVPFEIGHARYALPALRFLAANFEQVTFLTFRKKLFPDLSEDTLLLLCEGRHHEGRSAQFQIRDLANSGSLGAIRLRNSWPIKGTRFIDSEAISRGEQRLIEALIPSKARDLYKELRHHNATQRLGALADVGIGYVTGANEFFHLEPEDSARWEIPKRFLRRCVRRGRALSGLRFTSEDWESLLGTSETGYLLHISSFDELPKSVKTYIEHGERAGVHKRYKCRTRSPWYRVPHVYKPDGFLTYMSGAVPRLVANHAGVVAPNSLHILRMRPTANCTSDGLAAMWQNSLTQLSVEIEGHALGGGMLKLEPTEAEQVLLPAVGGNKLDELASDLNEIARIRGDQECKRLGDERLLRHDLGLSTSDIECLRLAADALRSRRSARSSVDERN